MKKMIYVFVPLFITLITLTSIISPCINMSEDISSKVFRLHIRANSNSIRDQELKIKVRDSLLCKTEDIFQNCNSVEDAVLCAEKNIKLINNTVKKTIKENGFHYDCNVRIDKEYFETRKYDKFSLPAGIYDSLIIEIGQGKGHNWWCVLFPSVCISGCTDEFEDVLSRDEIEMIESDKYILRFKVVEIYERIKNKS